MVIDYAINFKSENEFDAWINSNDSLVDIPYQQFINSGSTSINNDIFEDVKVYSGYNNSISIEGLDSETVVEVYNIVGIRLYNEKIRSNNARLNLDKTGIYIVRLTQGANTKALKVLVR
jgi:hypothetical protein